MQVVHQRCCGLDVHKKTVVACIMVTLATGEVQKQVRTFSTMTVDLLTLADWRKRVPGDACRDGIDRGILETGV